MAHLEHADLVGVAGASRLISGRWVDACPPYIFGQIAGIESLSKMFGVVIWGTPARRIDGIKALDGVFFCAKRQVAQTIPLDAQTFDGFYCYDVDFSFRAHLAGFRLAVGCDLLLLHHSVGDWGDEWARYERAFRQKHSGRLDVLPQRGFLEATATCQTRDELIEVMTPPWSA